MTKEATDKQQGDFEDLFEDNALPEEDEVDVFSETEKSVEEEELASKGEAVFDGQGKSAGGSGGGKKMIMYVVGGVVILGLCWGVYRQFNPAHHERAHHKVGPTRILKINHPRPHEHVSKPKPKSEAGFLVNEKNLKQMISNFTKSTNSALDSVQNKLNSRINNMQTSLDKSYENNQKEFSQVGKQLKVLVLRNF